MTNRLDSIYRKTVPTVPYREYSVKAKPVSVGNNNTLFYFYKSLRIVLVIWIIIIVTVTVTPWANYWVKSKLNPTRPEVLGQNTTQSQTESIFQSKEAFFEVKNEKVEIKAPIVEGIDEQALQRGLGHHSESVWPNQKGNMVIAGHSFDLNADNPYSEVFGSLRELNVGDEVKITYQNKNYVYKIFNRQVVAPNDTSLLGVSDNWQLTFYTCDPPKTDWRRLVFQAELIKIE